ncbi:asparagine-rich antigen, partial [Reticulomyxa filosa]
KKKFLTRKNCHSKKSGNVQQADSAFIIAVTTPKEGIEKNEKMDKNMNKLTTSNNNNNINNKNNANNKSNGVSHSNLNNSSSYYSKDEHEWKGRGLDEIKSEACLFLMKPSKGSGHNNDNGNA